MTARMKENGILSRAIHRVPWDGSGDVLPSKDEVGSKAHNLMRMARAGLPVPPGFVLSTDICRQYLKKGAAALDGLDAVLSRELDHLGRQTDRFWADDRKPFFVSVRSGAAISMPGMMETVLNIGLNAATHRGLVRMTGNPRLAEDCRRRLIQQYGEVVHAIPPSEFEARERLILSGRGAIDLGELDIEGLRQLSLGFEETFESATGHSFPDDPLRQARAAVEAVLKSWTSPRAKAYRKVNGISDEIGTAVTIQTMVFGNLGPTSGSGVGFTRNPSDGSNELYVDYLPNAQGEDVVSGRRRAFGLGELERRSPAAYRRLLEARATLEHEFAEMQDFEFTVENDRLYFLQSRAGKRTPLAALRIAHDLHAEGLISAEDASARLQGIELDEIAVTRLSVPAGLSPAATGIPAGAGVAVGEAIFDPARVARGAPEGRPAILFRQTAETAEFEALSGGAALVAAEGARTSHAAVVARQLGKPCIVGCRALTIDSSARSGHLGGCIVSEGDPVSVDGSTGEIYLATLEILSERPEKLLAAARSWATTADREPSQQSDVKRAAASRRKRGAAARGPAEAN